MKTKRLLSLSLSLVLWLALTGLALAQGPTVTATDPLTNEVGVALTHSISLTYSQAIDVATANTGAIVAQGMMGGLLTGAYSVSGANVTLAPARPFFPNEIVRTTATSNAQNLSGTGAEPYQWQFTAGAVSNRCVGGFSQQSTAPTGVWLSSVTWGDYDNDGDLDILLAGYDSGWAPVTEAWRNDGPSAGWTFSQHSTAPTGVLDASVAWGDYDNDGDLDILLAGYSSGGSVTEVWRNDGPSSGWAFSQHSTAPTGVWLSSVAWGDYDNDGDLDILLAGLSASGRVTEVWRNNDCPGGNIYLPIVLKNN